MAEPISLEAPIVAVTVYPSQARVTRRGTVRVPAGVHDITIGALPTSLLDDSVRVSGKGERARIVGVDIARRFYTDAPDIRVTDLDERLRDLRHQDQELFDADAAEATRAAFLGSLATRGGRSFAQALATGEASPEAVATFGDTLTQELTQVQARRREVAEQRERLVREIASVESELATIRAQQGTERREIVVGIEVDADTEIELDAAYVVLSAGWHTVYDARLQDERVTITWHGMIAQASGEDWPAVDVALSTARPSVSTKVPELVPWFVDAWAPTSRGAAGIPVPMSAPAPTGAYPDAMMAERAVMAEPEAVAEQGATAVTYRLPRPVPVPADGAPRKATITTVELEAKLDHITVPKLAEEAYLRATVTNTSTHTLLPGSASVFHGADFVGTTALDTVAPGEEVELQLGVDDRFRVERELVRRDTDRNLLGGKRKVSVAYRITVENHSPRATVLTVLDQFPVSRHEGVKVRDQEARPDPVERTDLDVVTWRTDLAADATATFELAFELEHPKGLHLSGWYD